jgi:hypothetical protein
LTWMRQAMQSDDWTAKFIWFVASSARVICWLALNGTLKALQNGVLVFSSYVENRGLPNWSESDFFWAGWNLQWKRGAKRYFIMSLCKLLLLNPHNKYKHYEFEEDLNAKFCHFNLFKSDSQ